MQTWKPNFATRLLTSCVMVSSVIFNAMPEAKAEMVTGNINGYRATVMQSDTMAEPDFMEVYGPQGKETIKVVCAPLDWESNGPNTANWVDSIAEEWCFGG